MQWFVFYQGILCDHILQRFDVFKKFEIFQFLCTENYLQFKKKFPGGLLKKLRNVYEAILCYSGLQSKLAGLYSLTDFAEKTFNQTFGYCRENDLINSFDKVSKLCLVILAIPSNTASVERSFLPLKQIHTCRRQRQGQERMSSLSLLSI